MEVSRNVKHGSLVTWRGKKLILCGRRSIPVGVYNMDSQIRGFTLDGERFNFIIPAGVRTLGEATANLAKEQEKGGV